MSVLRPMGKIAGFCILFAASQAAFGQVAPPPPAAHFDPIDAQRTMATFSRCVVENRNRRALALRFVRLLPTDPRYGELGRDISTGTCVPRNAAGRMALRFQPDLFRLALFEALYREDFGRSPPPDVQALPPLLLSSEFDGRPEDVPESIRFMRLFGDCAARRDSAGIHALLRTRIGTEEERAGIEALGPAMANCLPAQERLRFSRGVLRGALAEGLYKCSA